MEILPPEKIAEAITRFVEKNATLAMDSSNPAPVIAHRSS
jgi:hypothetical protein